MPVFPIKNVRKTDGVFTLDPEQLHHLTKVLRHKKGDQFTVSLPNGTQATAVLLESEESGIGKIIDKPVGQAVPQLPLWIGIGLIRIPRLEWLVEKLTELGTARISLLYLTNSRFNQKKPISEQKLERFKKIAQETLKQCEHTNTPQIESPTDLNIWLRRCDQEPGSKLIFSERSDQERFTHSHFIEREKQIFLIGPEGGFTDAEFKSCLDHGFKPVSLGEKILKSETAALYGACLLDAFLKL